MKMRQYEHDYLNDWRDGYDNPYIWLQVNYLTDSLKPYHFVSENNDLRKGHILWPISNKLYLPLPCTDFDFRNEKKIGFSSWHNELTKFSGTKIFNRKEIKNEFSSYEDYIRHANLSGSSCIDIDIIEVAEAGKKIVGIEGTHLFKEMHDKEEALRLFDCILEKRFFKTGAHQLIVQYKTLQLFSAKFFLMIYNTKDEKLKNNGNSLIIEIDSSFIEALKNKNYKECSRKAIFDSFINNYKKMIQG